MGHIKTHAFTNMPEARQVKMVCEVPNLYQFIPVQACNSTYFLQKHVHGSIKAKDNLSNIFF